MLSEKRRGDPGSEVSVVVLLVQGYALDSLANSMATKADSWRNRGMRSARRDRGAEDGCECIRSIDFWFLFARSASGAIVLKGLPFGRRESPEPIEVTELGRMGQVLQLNTRCFVHLIGDRTEWWMDSGRRESGVGAWTPQA